MKKILFIIMAAALVSAACTNMTEDAPVSSEKMVKIRLSTVSPPEIIDTRTMLDGNFDVKWQHGDEVFMVSDNSQSGGIKTGKLTNILEDGYEGLFEGEVPEGWLSNKSRETVLYSCKASEWSASGGYTLTETNWGKDIRDITLPSEQPLVPGTFARHYNLSAATFELNDHASSLYFHNLCGLLRVSLYGNAEIKDVRITAPGKMNGVFTLKSDYEVGEKTVYDIALNEKGSSDIVTLYPEDRLELTAEPQTFYACVLPENIKVGSTENAGPCAGDYTVSVTTVEGKVVTKTVPVEKGLSAGRYIDLGEMMVNYTFADADGTAYEFNPTGESVKYKYFVAGSDPDVEVAPEDGWLQYSVGDGEITFSAGLYIGNAARSASVTITQGTDVATITFSQSPIPALKLSSVYSDAAKHEGYVIEKTENMTDDYTLDVDESIDWFTAVKNADGNIEVSVEANSTGFNRNGVIRVMMGETVAGTVNVVQTTFDYSSFVGKYSITFNNSVKSWTGEKTGTLIFSAVEEGLSYEVTLDGRNSTFAYSTFAMTLYYAGIGPGAMILSLPQHSDIVEDDNGKKYTNNIYVAKKPLDSDMVLDMTNFSQIETSGEGLGYDLTPVLEGGSLSFDFVPNFATSQLYPGGLAGIWFPGDYVPESGLSPDTVVDLVRLWFRPLDGQEYLRIIKK